MLLAPRQSAAGRCVREHGERQEVAERPGQSEPLLLLVGVDQQLECPVVLADGHGPRQAGRARGGPSRLRPARQVAPAHGAQDATGPPANRAPAPEEEVEDGVRHDLRVRSPRLTPRLATRGCAGTRPHRACGRREVSRRRSAPAVAGGRVPRPTGRPPRARTAHPRRRRGTSTCSPTARRPDAPPGA